MGDTNAYFIGYFEDSMKWCMRSKKNLDYNKHSKMLVLPIPFLGDTSPKGSSFRSTEDLRHYFWTSVMGQECRGYFMYQEEDKIKFNDLSITYYIPAQCYVPQMHKWSNSSQGILAVTRTRLDDFLKDFKKARLPSLTEHLVNSPK